MTIIKSDPIAGFIIDSDTSGNIVFMSESNVIMQIDNTGKVDMSRSRLIVPVGNTQSRPTVAINGMLRFNSDTSGFEAYASNNWTSINILDVPVQYLVVAGGGAGGSNGGAGGGAGGFRTGNLTTITRTAIPVTVGAGGAVSGVGIRGGSGSSSNFNTIISTGGGGGGSRDGVQGSGGPGGSGGGGGGADAPQAAGTGNTPPVSPPQGNPGGINAGVTVNQLGGGGGGAGTPGGDPVSPRAGNGGEGANSSITGSLVTYAGGGGGGHTVNGTNGNGGSGGGGPGLVAGTTNLGGGGGSAAAGGSGVVILRYPTAFTLSNPTGGLTYTTNTISDFRVTTFTAGTGSIQWS